MLLQAPFKRHFKGGFAPARGSVQAPLQALFKRCFRRHFAPERGVVLDTVQAQLEVLQRRHSSGISILACDAALGVVCRSEHRCRNHLEVTASRRFGLQRCTAVASVPEAIQESFQ